MKTVYKFLVTLIFLSTFTSRATSVDSVRLAMRTGFLNDTVIIEKIIAYTFSWPHPKFEDVVSLINDGLAFVDKKHLAPRLKTGLLSRKVSCYAENNKGIEAFEFCQELKRIGEETNNNEVIGNSYYLRGNIFSSYSMLGKAIDEEKQAIEYYIKANNQMAAYDGKYLLAWYSFNNKDYNTALSNFLEAYRYYINTKSEDFNKLGEYAGWVGNSFSAVKQFDSAVYYRQLGIDYFKKSKNNFGWADCYRYLGNIYRNMKQYDSAMVNYQRALTMFGEQKTMDRYWLVQYFIAETNRALTNYQASAKTLDVLLDTVTGTKDLLSLYLGNQLGGFVYEKTGEYQKSIRCYKKYIVFKDSMEKTGQQGAVTELDAKLKFEQEENAFKLEQAEKDAQAAREKEKQIIIRNVFIGGFIITGLFLVVVYRNYQEKQKANKLLEAQKNEIESQKKEIQDSINYAQNIQTAVLPDSSEIQKHFSDMFLLYKPKDVVSGDFFWYNKTKDSVLIAAADCTGHGVPGAFMSMIGSYELNNSVQERGLSQPSQILSHINFSLKKRLKQNEEQTKNKDGMDIVLCAFDINKLQLQYAGANRPLFIIRNNEALEFAPTKAAIGGYTENEKQFENTIIQLQKGDCVYMYTDGYSDQFGGEKNKKLTTKNFKNLLRSIAGLSMKEQYQKLENYFYEWKGNFEQLDDVLVIGIKI